MLYEKIAFFDFCETLVSFQTADAFVDYVRRRSRNKHMQRWEKLLRVLRKFKLVFIAERLTKGRFSISKRLKLYQLKGFNEKEIGLYAQGYYKENIRPNLVSKVLDILRRLQDDGWSIVLVSGGYDVYLKEFAREFGISKIHSSEVSFKKNLCTGRLKGKDCMGDNKIRLLDFFYNRDEIVSKSFSDSESDVPFLSWANEGFVVSHNSHKKWVEKYNFVEIIW